LIVAGMGIALLIYFFVSVYYTIGDCTWNGTAKAWIDENRNGIWDSDESPLPNVVFQIDDTYNKYYDVGYYSVSDSEGTADLSVWLPGYPKVMFVIHGEPPANYINSTADRVKAKKQNEKEYAFGYYYPTNMPSPTPRPSSQLDCSTFNLLADDYSYANITDISLGPDNSVWVGTNNNILSRFSPDRKTREDYSTDNGLPDPIIRTIEIDPEGMVWVGTNAGASLFNGESWSIYTTNDGLSDNMVEDILVENDGSVWFATSNGVSKFIPSSGEWITNVFNNQTLTSDYWVSGIGYIPDDSYWFFGSASIYRLSIQSDWQVIKRDFNDTFGGLVYMNDMIVFDGELLWFSGKSDAGPSIVNFNPIAQQTTTYSHRTTGGAMAGGEISSMEVVSDGSLWIGLSENGLLHFISKNISGNNEGQWIHYIRMNGLPSNNVTQVAIDLDGYIWVGSDHGQVSYCSID
jgi:streptogramin lyase